MQNEKEIKEKIQELKDQLQAVKYARTRVISVRLDTSTYETLKAHAKQSNSSISNYIKSLIELDS